MKKQSLIQKIKLASIFVYLEKITVLKFVDKYTKICIKFGHNLVWIQFGFRIQFGHNE